MDESESRLAAGPVLGATVVVQELDRAVGGWVDGFGWRAAPATSGGARRCAVVEPPAGAAMCTPVRFLEVPEAAALPPLHRIGWTALELVVTDVESAARRAVGAGWRELAEPAPLGTGGGLLRAVQLAGPGGEVVYLTEIRGSIPGFELPTARVPVDGIFIAVLGADDLEGARRDLVRATGGRVVTDHPRAVNVLNRAYGLSPGTLHRISTTQLGGESCVEVDQLPTAALVADPARSVGIREVALRGGAKSGSVVLAGGAVLDLVAKGPAATG